MNLNRPGSEAWAVTFLTYIEVRGKYLPRDGLSIDLYGKCGKLETQVSGRLYICDLYEG